MKGIQLSNKEPQEQVKQDKVTKKKKLVAQIHPHKGHVLYSYNEVTKEIKEASFDINPVINWYDALSGIYSKYKKLTKVSNCIYISCLNKENVVKILKRDYKIEL